MRSIAIAVTAVLLGLLAGCSADAPPIDSQVYFCDADSDCGAGWLCTDSNVVSDDFCAAECDPMDASSCRGFCTSEGRCLPGCVINPDGSTTEDRDCPSGMDCVRLSSRTISGVDNGICYPATSCTVDEDCAMLPGYDCPLSDELPASLAGMFRFDHYYCVPSPAMMGDRCPSGWIAVTYGSGPTARRACLPGCGDPGVPGGTIRCPPATGCVSHVAPFLADPSVAPCFPGYWGTPCEDQSSCLLGSCRDLPNGRSQCTETCADAEALAQTLGVTGLPDSCLILTGLVGTALYRCEAELCVPYQRALGTCDESVTCIPGYECRELMFPDTPTFDGCVKMCTVDGECEDPGAFCFIPPAQPAGVCALKLADGAECGADVQCQSEVCTPEGFCMRRMMM
jgi:hypothetical protein